MFLQRLVVANLVLSPGNQAEALSFSMLWLISYTFLLRVPSEALPICKCDSSVDYNNEQAALYIENGRTLCLRLKSRKNAPRGCILKRYCTCSAEYPDHMCPTHTLWEKFFAALVPGTKPWAAHSPGYVTARLRCALQELQVDSHLCENYTHTHTGFGNTLQVPGFDLYGLHDLRRGHAKVLLFILLIQKAVHLSLCVGRICSLPEYHCIRFERLEDGEVTLSSSIWMNASSKPILHSKQPCHLRVMNS